MRKFQTILLSILLSIPLFVSGDEGMWLPYLLSNKQYEELQARGFRLSPEDLYSINQASLKDAIVLFGRGCTGEIVSSEGLLLTNHHCGFSRIQSHSSVTSDYLADGFWAASFTEELPNPGLTASILIRMEDVTAKVEKVLINTMTEKERNEAIRKVSAEIAKKATEGTHYEAEVKPFYYGNQFIMMVMEVFQDVRLVGAPPSAIGKFGGDTDNWMWPRHTGDFSIFRIYAGKDNKPAAYDKGNLPYKPLKFLEISLKGVKEGDFTMVYGFPAQTEQYLPSAAISHLQNNIYPVTVNVRDTELDIINAAMASSQELRIMYAARQASVANGWKKLKGVIPGLEQYHVIALKEAEEQSRIKALETKPALQSQYKSLISSYQALYSQMQPSDVWNTYFNECFWKQAFFRFVFKAYWLPEADLNTEKGAETYQKTVEEIIKALPGFYKSIDLQTEQQLMSAMITLFVKNIPADQLPDALKKADKKYKGDFNAYTKELFSRSMFANPAKAEAFFAGKVLSVKKLKQDPIFGLMSEIVTYYRTTTYPMIQSFTQSLDSLHRLHMRMIMDFTDPSELYPDANSSLRISFGQVQGSQPRDGVRYLYQSTLQGILMKEDGETEDYTVPARLKEIADPLGFAGYGEGDVMPVAFIASNHTTGGNSGSPVLDKDGRLIGINFDRAWEGTMSDLHYEPAICRNISIDMRYLLFIIDRYAGATRLINEMVIFRD